jgi:hypothetical protein
VGPIETEQLIAPGVEKTKVWVAPVKTLPAAGEIKTAAGGNDKTLEDELGSGLGDCDGDATGDGEGLTVMLGLGLGEGDKDGDGDALGTGAWDGDGDAEGCDDALTAGLGEEDATGVGVETHPVNNRARKIAVIVVFIFTFSLVFSGLVCRRHSEGSVDQPEWQILEQFGPRPGLKPVVELE